MSKISKLCDFGLKSLPFLQGSFSQFGEDFFLRCEFKDINQGFFVDVGAFHPYKFSNMHYLRSKGWKGINIEPQPSNFKILSKHTGDINLNLAVASKPGVCRFRLDGVCSSLVEDDAKGENIIEVKTKRLDEVLDDYCREKIDLLSVDCEGFDIDVLASNNWEKYRPSIVMVEDHSMELNSEVDEFLGKLDYKMISWYRLTKFYAPTSWSRKA